MLPIKERLATPYLAGVGVKRDTVQEAANKKGAGKTIDIFMKNV
jgi:hypothetical protein